MGYENVLAYQERLVRNYKYRPLPTLQQEEARTLYRENIPEGFCLDGADVALYGQSGMKIAERYNRIVIGDYGAFAEILADDIAHENLMVKKGQEYRDQDPRFSGKVKFSWLTLRDGKDVQVNFQKKEVAFADYVPGRYYVSVFDCVPEKIQEKNEVDRVGKGISGHEIADWLKENGVYSDEMFDYYAQMVPVYGRTLQCAVERGVPPFEFELWLNICDVCQEPDGLTFEQLAAISYNLQMIGCTGSELRGKLEVLEDDVRTAIELGLECFEIPFEMQKFDPDMVRELLKMPFDNLMAISRFSKVIAGHKAEVLEPVRDVAEVIADANKRVVEATSRYNEYEHMLG